MKADELGSDTSGLKYGLPASEAAQYEANHAVVMHQRNSVHSMKFLEAAITAARLPVSDSDSDDKA